MVYKTVKIDVKGAVEIYGSILIFMPSGVT